MATDRHPLIATDGRPLVSARRRWLGGVSGAGFVAATTTVTKVALMVTTVFGALVTVAKFVEVYSPLLK